MCWYRSLICSKVIGGQSSMNVAGNDIAVQGSEVKIFEFLWDLFEQHTIVYIINTVAWLKVMCNVHGKTHISRVSQTTNASVQGKTVAKVGDKCACGTYFIKHLSYIIHFTTYLLLRCTKIISGCDLTHSSKVQSLLAGRKNAEFNRGLGCGPKSVSFVQGDFVDQICKL
jgi:hypothetical protein